MKLDLLLDTHIVIWMATAPSRIPKRLLGAIETAGHRFVSHATALEIQLKHLKRPELFPFSLHHLDVAMKEFSCTELRSPTATLERLDRCGLCIKILSIVF